ncbi:MAG: S8 family serine peptidase [Synechococcales cyanobacterium CRU_2_2]|nr:S8 family serine peptidase [Synechococcales cyanobacterium CRU_2_2]
MSSASDPLGWNGQRSQTPQPNLQPNLRPDLQSTGQSSLQPPLPKGQSSPFGGVPEGREGLILQRGGEELVLLKSRDRFTVRLAPEARVDAFLDSGSRFSAAESPAESFWRMLPVLDRQPLPSGLQGVRVAEADLEAAMAQARQSGATQYVSHVYELHNDPRAQIYLTDELTVQLAQPLTSSLVTALMTPLGLVYERAIEGIENTHLFRVGKTAPENPVKLANRLMTRPEVLLAEPNVIIPSQSSYRPKDNLYSRQWYLHHGGGTELSANSHINAEGAWDVTRGDRSVVIAIADDAIDISHPDFQGLGKVVAPRDLREQDFSPLPTGTDDNHGTAVAGVAVAEENGQGIVGVAPGCAMMPIRTTGFLDDASVEGVFDWARTKGAAVVCCSWGAGAVRFPLSLRQRAAMTRAATQGRNGKGCVITFAAGNFNRPLNSTVQEQGWPKNVLTGVTTWLNGYAVHPDVITVGACTSQNKKAAYSNWGDELFICAPSNNAPPAIWLEQTGYIEVPPKYNTRLPGAPVITTDRTGTAGYSRDSYTDLFGGTSSACPVVAGVVGLMLSVNPNLTVAEVKRILQQTADKILDRDPDPQFNVNFGTYEANGHSRWFGYGKVNAAKAVQAAAATVPGATKPQQQVTVKSAAAVKIGDRAMTQTALQVQQTGLLKSLTIQVDLEHGYLGDLELRLVSPSQESILLQSRILGRRTQLQTTYNPTNTPLLKRLLQKPAQGQWLLQMTDHATTHTGTLKLWQLTLGV